MLVGMALATAGIRFIDVRAVHRSKGPHIELITLRDAKALEEFNAWAKKEGIPVDEARLATPEEIADFEILEELF